CSLCAFKQNTFSVLDGGIQQVNRVTHHRLQDFCVFFVLRQNFFEINVLCHIECSGQCQLVGCEIGVHFLKAAIDQVCHADAPAADLVLIAGTDSTRSGPDCHTIRTAFRQLFHHPVE